MEETKKKHMGVQREAIRKAGQKTSATTKHVWQDSSLKLFSGSQNVGFPSWLTDDKKQS